MYSGPVESAGVMQSLSPHKANLQKFLEYVPKGSFILVVGCGDGRLNSDISQDNYKVIGIDKNSQKIESARTSFLGLEFHNSDVLEMKLDTEFQGIWLGSFFSKMEEEEQEKVLNKIKEVLDKKGWLYLSCPNQQNGSITSLVEKARFTIEHQIVDFELQLICQSQ